MHERRAPDCVPARAPTATRRVPERTRGATPMKPAFRAAIAGSLFIIAGCSAGPSDIDDDSQVESAALASHVNKTGKQLFEEETFGGNGRTCSTCHEKETGSLSPASVQARFADDPSEPLFRAIDSDDGVSGASYERLKT